MDSATLLAEIGRATTADPVDPAYLEGLCLEVDGRILRGDLMLGLLPPAAPEVMARGYAAAGASGRAQSWVHLGRNYRDGHIGATVDWPSAPDLPDDPHEPDGAALRCFAEAAALGDRIGALSFASTSRDCSEQARRTALSLLAPLLDDDPQGTATYWYGLVEYALGDAAAGAATQRLAAGLGNADAMFELYVLYVQGDGVERDEAAAHDWLLRAAGQGQPRALYNVGAGHATGRDGFPKDGAKAVEYYERAARAGNPQAAATLGVMHLVGDTVEADPARAARWLDEAEADGFDVDDWLTGLGLERP